MDRVTTFARHWLPLGRTITALLLVVAAGWLAWPSTRSSTPGTSAAPALPTAPATVAAPTPPPGALPGSQIWNSGASSFLFGTNDSYEWSDQNLETMPSIQLALRNAGFTLVRTFIPDNDDDATLELRIKTIENIGAKCLAVLTNVNDTTFNEHVVSYFGNRCQLYEFGN